MNPRLFLVPVLLVLAGCPSHDRLYFIEQSHIGLKATAAADPTPADIDFGYRRSVVALIPKADATEPGKSDTERTAVLEKLTSITKAARQAAEEEAKNASKPTVEAATFVEDKVRKARKDYIDSYLAAKGDDPACPGDNLDRSEPLSVISSFNADIAWFDASKIHTYFATGVAATKTACSSAAIKALVTLPNE
ncbi:MAG: hypothetical protein H8K08_06645 [Nitrospira sp.]|nr:hypothetical protein [Nitrospira sp.]